jgi:membrane fusion protein (multidrug efflux system)
VLTVRAMVRASIAALAAGLAVVLGGCASRAADDVVVTPVQVGTLTVTPGGSAAVVGVADSTITVSRRGTVSGVSVAPGQEVRAGQPLAVVRELGTPNEQKALASELEGLQTLLTSQRITQGPTSPQVAQALARIAAVREQLAEVIGAPAVLTAPHAGVVAALGVGTGSEVDTSTPLMRIVDMSSVRITVELAGEYRTAVHVGDHGSLVAAGTGGREVPATVTALVPSTTGDGGFQVTATAANPGALAIGSTAYLMLPERLPKVTRVLTRAVLGTSAKPYVYVVENGRASLVPVVVGPSDGTWTQVVSGLHPGQRVVLTGNQRLAESGPVQVSGEEAPS